MRHATVKTPRATAADAAKPATPTTPELSAKTRKLIDAVRAPFSSFVTQYAELMSTRADLAPSFMRAFGAFAQESGQTFVDFCRLLDPSIGPTRADYRVHRSYLAADYLRRLAAQQSRPRVAPSTPATAPATPLDGMARLLAAMLPLISADQVSRLWETVSAELHWTERQITSLQHRVENADALVNVRPPRGAGGTVPQLRIAPVRHTADQEQGEALKVPA